MEEEEEEGLHGTAEHPCVAGIQMQAGSHTLNT
jgi:hypothetical protein